MTPYIFIITLYPVAFVSVDDATLLCDGILIFGSHQEVFDGITSIAIYLYPMFSAYIFQAFTQPFDIWNHHIGPLIARCSIGTEVSAPIVLVLIRRYIDFHVHSVQSPYRVLFSSRTLCRWSSSFFSSWGLEHTALAL